LFRSENLANQIYLIFWNNPTVPQRADNNYRSLLCPFVLVCCDVAYCLALCLINVLLRMSYYEACQENKATSRVGR